jgi:hypothetical protein
MAALAGYVALFVIVFLVGYYVGRAAGRTTVYWKPDADPADWWKDGREPPH